MRSLTVLALGGLLTALASACSSSMQTPPGSSGDSTGRSGSSSSSSGAGTASTSSSSSGSASGGGPGAGAGGSGASGASGGSGASAADAGSATGSSSSTSSSSSSGTGGATGSDAGRRLDAGGDGAVGTDAGAVARDGGADAGVVPASSITCNAVLGIDTTSEWYEGGFENQVNDAKWEIIFHHPGFVANWADPNDAVWSTAPTSACATNPTNPDRVIFNGFADATDTTYMSSDAWVAGLTKVIANLKAKYSNLRRVDLLTMTRAPGNMPCMTGNRQSVVETYVDDAISRVVAADPGFVTASPKFFAPSCDVFTMGGPHFTDAGKPIVAKIYGDYYSTEP
ncbi:MAG: hypothetical protein JOZ69_22680 [Myxococcales bacterium]|nr:hypothetical protein [Myxococcales bacterium]